jgi:1-acyl-sn-glycerol-3-phosphate acyltransferase
VRYAPVFARGDTALYRFARAFFALTLAFVYRYRVEGIENVPRDGAVLIAVNHKSDVDPILVGLSFQRPLHFIAKAELFRNRFLGWAITRLGAIPVRRGESDRDALQNALAVLASGEALLVFPEGTRFHDDEIHKFLPGVGMLAMRSGVAVVPVAIRGSQTALQKGKPRLQRIRLRAGTPVDLSGLEGRRSAVYAEAAERIRTAVGELYDGLG